MANWPYGTKQWRTLRAAHLSRSPMCEACQGMGRLTIANHVDHRTPISAGGHAFPSFDGLASLCASCHSAKTARGVEAGAIRTTKTRKGCNADGTPLDPMHGWNRTGDAKCCTSPTNPRAHNTAAKCGSIHVTKSAANCDTLIVPQNEEQLQSTHNAAIENQVTQSAAPEKSLRAEPSGPAGDTKIELVSRGNRYGR